MSYKRMIWGKKGLCKLKFVAFLIKNFEHNKDFITKYIYKEIDVVLH